MATVTSAVVVVQLTEGTGESTVDTAVAAPADTIVVLLHVAVTRRSPTTATAGVVGQPAATVPT